MGGKKKIDDKWVIKEPALLELEVMEPLQVQCGLVNGFHVIPT